MKDSWWSCPPLKELTAAKRCEVVSRDTRHSKIPTNMTRVSRKPASAHVARQATFCWRDKKTKNKTQVRTVSGEEQRSSAALRSRRRQRLQVWARWMKSERVCTANKARLPCWHFTSRCFLRSSHKGGLVSPTDRPTINAMTASRISRANAMMMYFCRMKATLVSKRSLRHASIRRTQVEDVFC